jgi:hypothetical protein
VDRHATDEFRKTSFALKSLHEGRLFDRTDCMARQSSRAPCFHERESKTRLFMKAFAIPLGAGSRQSRASSFSSKHLRANSPAKRRGNFHLGEVEKCHAFGG